MTNFEKIKKSREALLALMMSVVITDCNCCPIYKFCKIHNDDDSHEFDTCIGTWEQWLKSEVEND